MAKNTESTLIWRNIQYDFSPYIVISNMGNKRPEEVLENVEKGSVRIFRNDLSWNLITIKYPNRRTAIRAARFLHNSRDSIEIRVRMAIHTIAFLSQLERKNFSEFKKPSYVMIDRFPGHVTLKRWTMLLSKFGNGMIVGFFRENSGIIVKFQTLAEVVGIAIALHERVVDGNKLLVRLYRSEKEKFLFSASTYDACKCMTSNCPLHPPDQRATTAHSREKGKSPFAYRPLPCTFCHYPGNHPTTGNFLKMECEDTLDDANVLPDDEFPEFKKDKLAGDDEECFYHFDCHAPRVSDVGWEVINFGDMEISNGERATETETIMCETAVFGRRETRVDEREGLSRTETIMGERAILGRRETRLYEREGLGETETIVGERTVLGRRESRVVEREGLGETETIMGERAVLGTRESRVVEREGLGGKEMSPNKRTGLDGKENKLNERERLAGRETSLEARETSLEGRENKLHELLIVRENRLEERENRLEERENKLHEQLIRRENRLEKRENRLEERENRLEERESKLHEQLIVRENRLEERENRLEERENRLEELESKLHEQLMGRESRLEGRESRLERREIRLEGREIRLDRREIRLEGGENRVELLGSGQQEGENTLEEEKRETGKQTAWKGKQTGVKTSWIKGKSSYGRKI